ncbi:hypothetical protein DPMN_080346 [Dreissena polymorpha]|uniref:Uncharacterized protein n=1 Tax=Dreissena polymorpha TaxID=45954 RepID=A0A9D3YTQ1_DREPO|nr:hypothetical protein DPMN_080346 [Dreissena polymorpha]
MPYFITPEMISMHYGNMEEETEWERRLQALRHKHNISQASMNHYKVGERTTTKIVQNHYKVGVKPLQSRCKTTTN